MHRDSLMVQCSLVSYVYSRLIANHFIVNFTSYLNVPGFEVVFSTAVVSLIESIGGRRAGGEWGGRWGWVRSRRWAKANIQTQMAVPYHQ